MNTARADATAATSRRAGRPPSAFVALVGYTLRSCIPPRRLAAVMLACAGAVGFGLLAYALDTTPERAFANVAAEGVFSLAMPVAALVIGDAVMGAEVRAGTFHFTWLSPVPTWQIVVARWLAGSLVAVLTITPACGAAALVAGVPALAGPALIAGGAGSVAYIGLFVAIGCITRRTAVWSLALVFLVERLLGAALTSIAQLSPQWEARAIFVGLLDDAPRRLERDGIPEGAGAVVRLAIVTAVALAVANWRVRRLRLAGASD